MAISARSLLLFVLVSRGDCHRANLDTASDAASAPQAHGVPKKRQEKRHDIPSVDSGMWRLFAPVLRALATVGVALGFLSLLMQPMQGLIVGDDKDALESRFLGINVPLTAFPLYAFFFVACTIFYLTRASVDPHGLQWKAYLDCVSAILECLGLSFLQYKISTAQSVNGMSRTTIIVLALNMTYRVMKYMVAIPPILSIQLLKGFTDIYAFVVLQVFALAHILICTRSVCVTYRSTYQQDLEVVEVRHVLGVCVALALLLRPEVLYNKGFLENVGFAFFFFLDSFALVPQVAMMARCDGTIQAPIVPFVAATTVSRMVDLTNWISHPMQVLKGSFLGVNYSGVIVIGAQFLSLLILVAFMWYHSKAAMYIFAPRQLHPDV